jgi:hypothetical protein
MKRWDELVRAGHDDVNPNLWRALLELASAGSFASHVIPLYIDEADEHHRTRIVARDKDSAVYDARLDVSAADFIGFDERYDADFYITHDGSAGRIVDLVRSGAQQCFFCAHWFSMNPRQEEGWRVFVDIVTRVNRHLEKEIEWMTPSTYGRRLLRSEI